MAMPQVHEVLIGGRWFLISANSIKFESIDSPLLAVAVTRGLDVFWGLISHAEALLLQYSLMRKT